MKMKEIKAKLAALAEAGDELSGTWTAHYDAKADYEDLSEALYDSIVLKLDEHKDDPQWMKKKGEKYKKLMREYKKITSQNDVFLDF